MVDYGIEALKQFGTEAVDADGKSGDGAEFKLMHTFLKEKFCLQAILDENKSLLEMVFLPRTDYSEQEKCEEIIGPHY